MKCWSCWEKFTPSRVKLWSIRPFAIDWVICWVKHIFWAHNPHLTHLQTCQRPGKWLRWVKKIYPTGGFQNLLGFKGHFHPRQFLLGFNSHSHSFFPAISYFSNDVIKCVRIIFASIHFVPPYLPFHMMSSNSSESSLQPFIFPAISSFSYDVM